MNAFIQAPLERDITALFPMVLLGPFQIYYKKISHETILTFTPNMETTKRDRTGDLT